MGRQTFRQDWGSLTHSSSHFLLLLSLSCFYHPAAESCAALRQTASISAATQTSSTSSPAKRKRAAEEDDDDDGVPKRALPDLMWPPDPLEEGLNALSDPLNRDEVKPLLHSELLAIGALYFPIIGCSTQSL